MKDLTKSTLKIISVWHQKLLCEISRPILPATDLEDTLSAFMAALAKEGVSYTSLKVYLAVIHHYQIQNGQGDPGISRMKCLEYIMKEIKRNSAFKPNPRKERQPITPTLLNKIHVFAVRKR